MATVKEALQAKIDTLKATAAAEEATAQAALDAVKSKYASEIADLEAHLAAAGSWLDVEFHALQSWASTMMDRLTGTTVVPAPAPIPAQTTDPVAGQVAPPTGGTDVPAPTPDPIPIPPPPAA